MGRATGGSGGVGGSMHLIDVGRGSIGANAIVGAGLPIAVGAAVGSGSRREGSPQRRADRAAAMARPTSARSTRP